MRMSMGIQLLVAAIAFGSLLVTPVHAGDLSQGRMLSASCAGCHGTDGRSPGAIPDISDKSADYIRVSLEEFRSGRRESTIMGRHAKGYTDEEIQLIAEYFGQKK